MAENIVVICVECGKERKKTNRAFPLCTECQTKRNNKRPFRKEGRRKKKW